jgi:hypothetical protein
MVSALTEASGLRQESALFFVGRRKAMGYAVLAPVFQSPVRLARRRAQKLHFTMRRILPNVLLVLALYLGMLLLLAIASTIGLWQRHKMLFAATASAISACLASVHLMWQQLVAAHFEDDGLLHLSADCSARSLFSSK